MTPEQREELRRHVRETHIPVERQKPSRYSDGRGCVVDRQVWPCDAIRLLDALDAGPRSEEGLREALAANYRQLEREHGHSSAWRDDTWPSCADVHGALRLARAVLHE